MGSCWAWLDLSRSDLPGVFLQGDCSVEDELHRKQSYKVRLSSNDLSNEIKIKMFHGVKV